MDNILLRSYSINIDGIFNIKDEDKEKLYRLSKDILYLYQIYWYYLSKFLLLDNLNDSLREKLDFFSKYHFIFKEIKYDYYEYDKFEKYSEYLQQDKFRYLERIKDNNFSQIIDDIEEIHDILFDGIFECRKRYDNILNVNHYIFVPDENLISILRKYNNNFTDADEQEINENCGLYWKQYWLLEPFNRDNIQGETNISTPKWNYLIIPPNCNYLLFQELILEKITKKDNFYTWCYSNPTCYFNQIQLKEFNICKKKRAIASYNFRNYEDNPNIYEQIQELYFKDIIESKEESKKIIARQFNAEIFQFYQTLPTSINIKNNDFIIKGNIILEENNTRNLSGEIVINNNLINLKLPIGNHFFFINQKNIRYLISENQNNYLPSEDKSKIIDSYEYYNFNKNSFKETGTQWIENNYLVKNYFNKLYQNQIKLEDTGEISSIIKINNNINNSINFTKLFDNYELNDEIISSILIKENNYRIKLYKPILIFNSEKNLDINKNIIIQWFSNKFKIEIENTQIYLDLNNNNFVSYLVNIGIKKKNSTEEVIITNTNNLDKKLRGDLVFSNNKIIKNIIIEDIIKSPNNLDEIENNSKIIIYNFEILIGKIYIFNNGNIEFQIPLNSKIATRYYFFLEKFIEKLKGINYLINPFNNKNLNVLPYPNKKYLQMLNQQFWLIENKNKIISENNINIDILKNLIISFSPICKLLKKEIIKDTNIELLDNSSNQPRWLLAKVSKKISDSEAEIVYILSGKEEKKIININIDSIRFVRDRKHLNSIKFLFNTSGIYSIINEFSYYIYLLKKKNLSDDNIVYILNKFFDLNKIISKKRLSLFNKEKLNYDGIILVNLILTESNEIEYHIDNINSQNDLDIIIKFIKYLIDLYNEYKSNNLEDIDDDVFKEELKKFIENNKESLIPNITEFREEKDIESDDEDDIESDDEDDIESDDEDDIESDDEDDIESDDEDNIESDDEDDIESDDEDDIKSDSEDIHTSKIDINEILNDILSESEDEDDDGIPVNNIGSVPDINRIYDIREKEFTQFSELKRRGPYLERLNYLFRKKGKKDSKDLKSTEMAIGKNCQGDGQPMAISDETKKFIDEYYKNSYGEDSLEIKGKKIINLDCEGTEIINTEESSDKKLEQCRSIRINNYWLICPKISCYHCWISLLVDNLSPNEGHLNPYLLINRKIGNNNLSVLLKQYNITYQELLMYNYDKKDLPKKILENINYADKFLNFKCKKFISKDPTYSTDNWSYCLNCNTSIFEHNVFCPLCNRGILFERTLEKYKKIRDLYAKKLFENSNFWKIKNYNNNNWDSLKIQKTAYTELEIPNDYMKNVLEEVKKNYELFSKDRSLKIVFKKKDNDLIRNYPAFTNQGYPCCYKSYSKSFLQNTNDYFEKEGILKKNDEIPEKEVNYILRDSISIKPYRKCLLPKILEYFFSTKYIEPEFNNCFLRYGIPSSNDSIFFIFTKILNEENDKNLTIENIKIIFLLSIKEYFNKLEKGKIKNIFIDPDKKITSLQNFIEYTFSDSKKIDYFYIDFFKKKYNIQIVFLHYDGEQIFLNTDNKIKFNTTNKYSFVVKRIINDFIVYELIFYNKGVGQSGQYVFQFNSDEPKSYNFNLKNKNIILGKPILDNFNKTINLIRKFPQPYESDVFTFDYKNTNWSHLNNILKKRNIPIEKFVRYNSENIYYIQSSKFKSLIPIYPEIINKIKDKDIYDFNQEMIETFDETIKSLEEIGNLGFNCKPKYINYILENTEKKPIGIFTENGYFIHCKGKLSFTNLIEISIPIENIMEINKRPVSYHIFSNLKSSSETLVIINDCISKNNNLKLNYKDLIHLKYNEQELSGYLVSGYLILVNTTNIAGFKFEPNTFIINDNYIINAKLKVNLLTINQINNIGYLISRLSDGLLATRPYRLKFNNEITKIPDYDKVLIESGFYLPIKKTLFFDIHKLFINYDESLKYIMNKHGILPEVMKSGIIECLINGENKELNNNIRLVTNERDFNEIYLELSKTNKKKIDINWNIDNMFFSKISFINLPYEDIYYKTIQYNNLNPDERVIEGNQINNKLNLYKKFRINISDYIHKFNLSSKINKILDYHIIPLETKTYMIKTIIELITKNIYLSTEDNDSYRNIIECHNITENEMCINKQCSLIKLSIENNQKQIEYILDNILDNLYQNLNPIELDEIKENFCVNKINKNYLEEFIRQLSDEIVSIPVLSNQILSNNILYDSLSNVSNNEILLINPSMKELEKKLLEKITRNYYNPFINFNIAYKSKILYENMKNLKLTPLINTKINNTCKIKKMDKIIIYSTKKFHQLENYPDENMITKLEKSVYSNLDNYLNFINKGYDFKTIRVSIINTKNTSKLIINNNLYK